MRLLLDTHIWIWSVFGDERLNSDARAKVDSGAFDLFVSAVSIWEIAMLVHYKRLHLYQPTRSWIETSLVSMEISVSPVDASIALESYNLPGEFHKDPADRMIVATARHLGLPILTQDKAILAYAKKGHVMLPK